MFSKKQNNKSLETDQQMLIRISIKFAVIFFVIFMFDFLLDGFSWFFDIVIELLHLLIESVEYSIELMLEYTLNSDHQQSETIIVNTAIILMFYGAYKLFRRIPSLCRRLKNKISLIWHAYIKQELYYWQSATLIRKIKIVTIYSVGVSSLLFLITL
ncbi:MAG: hypothetical protein KAT04_15520 [Methylococcales bacterium]|nr:hypothetical protein [Methylococcales bacterium]